MLNVFLTVDTEVWPFSPGWPKVPLHAAHSDFSRELGFYIYGDTGRGSFGVPFQLKCLNEHGLRATYFVEALFGSVAGTDPLNEVVSLIQSHGQEVQLHIHTEWLGEIRDPELPGGFRQHIRHFPVAQQAAILRHGAAKLREAGVQRICAFRAGNFGADFETLRALETLGIFIDSSHNTCRLGSTCALDTGDLLTQPRLLENVYEFPLSYFRDYPGHFRQAQLCACSYEELREAMLRAWRAGWYSFVILLHGSELLGELKSFERPTAPNATIVRRFTKLCRFLADNQDKFRTRFFSDIDTASIPLRSSLPPLHSAIHRTAWRYAEQLAGRFL